MSKLLKIVLITAALAAFLSACAGNRQKQGASEADTVRTAAAATANARLTEMGPRTVEPTTTPYVPRTSTPEPSATAPALPSKTAPPASTATNPGSPDVAEWVSQSPADFTSFAPGTPFKMTWTIRNAGKSTWTRSYQLRFYANNQMGGPTAVNFPKDVAPGETVDLSVDLVAPSSPGDYNSIWVLTSDKTGNFYPIDVSIKVGAAPAATQTVTPTTPPPTATTEADS